MGDVEQEHVPIKDTTHTLEKSPMENPQKENTPNSVAVEAQGSESTVSNIEGSREEKEGGVMCDSSDKVEAGPLAPDHNSDVNGTCEAVPVGKGDTETSCQEEHNSTPGNVNCDIDAESIKAESMNTDTDSQSNNTTGDPVSVSDKSMASTSETIPVDGSESKLDIDKNQKHSGQNAFSANDEAGDAKGLAGGERTGAPGEAGMVTENGVGNGHATAATTETPAPGGGGQGPTGGGLLEEGGDRQEVGQVPMADNLGSGVTGDTDKTDKSPATAAQAEESKLGQVENNPSALSEDGDNASNSKCDTTEGISSVNEGKGATGSDALDNSEGRDISETASSMSYSALTSPSEGSVTLDSATSVSSLDDLVAAGAVGIAPGEKGDMTLEREGGEGEEEEKEEARLAEASNNGANTSNNTPPGADDPGACPPAVGGVPSLETQTQTSSLHDDQGVVASSPSKPQEEEKDRGGPQSADKNLQEQDAQDVKPDPEKALHEEGDKGTSQDAGQTPSSVNQPKDLHSNNVSNCESLNGQIKESNQETEKATETEGAGSKDSLGSEQVDGNNSEKAEPTPVTKEDVKSGNKDVPPAGEEARSSIGLIPAVATSPDSSFASSGPSCPVVDTRIDPYSVALDDALGSSSFNTSFVSTDISTDPDHTDAESAESSPRDPDMTLVSSVELKDSAMPSPCDQTMEESKSSPKSPPGEGEINSTQKPESVCEPPTQTCDQPSKDLPQADLTYGSQVNSKTVKGKPCGLEPPQSEQQVTTDTEPTSTPLNLATGQVSDNGVCENIGAVGPIGSEVVEGSGDGEVGPGEAATPVGAQEGGQDQKVDQPGETLATTSVDTVSDDVSTPSKTSDTKTEDVSSTQSPEPASSETSTSADQSPTENKSTEELKEECKDSKLTDEHKSQKPEAVEQQPDKVPSPSSSPSKPCEQLKVPEVVVMDASTEGEDEPDGSRPIISDTSGQQGASSVPMAPPTTSVVMRKKLGVRQPTPPVKKDVQLQQKIDHEIKMRDGTAKLLAASKHPSQLLEAAKNLLTSNSRMIAYMSELQRRKTDEVLNRHRKSESVKIPCKAKVAVSDIRIPLMWKDSDHFKNKGDHRRFAVFCVLKIGTQINDTTLLKDVDSSMTDLTFEDVIIFESVEPNFECQLEVYCHKLSDDHASSTPRRIRKRFSEISTSVGRSVGRRLSGLKEDPEFMANMIVGPKFEMIASATLTLADVRDSISIFDLPENSAASTDGGSTELPLFGNFCCRVAAQPRCMMVDAAVGGVQLKAGPEGWRKAWCMLGKQNFHTWTSERDQKQGQEPLVDVTITSDARVKVTEEKGETGYALQLSAWSNGRRRHFQIATDCREDRDIWASSLQQHIIDIGAWKQACDRVMDIEQTTPPNRRSTFSQRPRSSLYEETPWNEDDSPMTRILNRLDLEEERDSLKPPV